MVWVYHTSLSVRFVGLKPIFRARPISAGF